MAVLVVRLHMDATVEVEAGGAMAAKERIQAALDRLTEPLSEMGAVFAVGNRFEAVLRAEEGGTDAVD